MYKSLKNFNYIVVPLLILISLKLTALPDAQSYFDSYLAPSSQWNFERWEEKRDRMISFFSPTLENVLASRKEIPRDFLLAHEFVHRDRTQKPFDPNLTENFLDSISSFIPFNMAMQGTGSIVVDKKTLSIFRQKLANYKRISRLNQSKYEEILKKIRLEFFEFVVSYSKHRFKQLFVPKALSAEDKQLAKIRWAKKILDEFDFEEKIKKKSLQLYFLKSYRVKFENQIITLSQESLQKLYDENILDPKETSDLIKAFEEKDFSTIFVNAENPQAIQSKLQENPELRRKIFTLDDLIFLVLAKSLFPEIEDKKMAALISVVMKTTQEVARIQILTETTPITMMMLSDMCALFNTRDLPGKPNIVENRFLRRDQYRFLCLAHDYLVQKGYPTGELDYPFGAGDVSTALLLTHAQTIRIYDALPFGFHVDPDIFIPFKQIYLEHKFMQGWHPMNVLKAIGCAKTILLWELEALGATQITVSKGELPGEYWIDYQWSFEGSAPQPRRIVYQETFIDTSDWDSNERKSIVHSQSTFFLSKTNLAQGLPGGPLPPVILSFMSDQKEGYERINISDFIPSGMRNEFEELYTVLEIPPDSYGSLLHGVILIQKSLQVEADKKSFDSSI